MNHDPVRIGKCLLGPRFTDLPLRGKRATAKVCFGTRDLEICDDWCRLWQRLRNGLPVNLKDEIQRAVWRDFNGPAFQRRLSKTALEYERRVAEQDAHNARDS